MKYVLIALIIIGLIAVVASAIIGIVKDSKQIKKKKQANDFHKPIESEKGGEVK